MLWGSGGLLVHYLLVMRSDSFGFPWPVTEHARVIGLRKEFAWIDSPDLLSLCLSLFVFGSTHISSGNGRRDGDETLQVHSSTIHKTPAKSSLGTKYLTFTLESLLKQQLREATEQRKELERQHGEALAALRDQKDDLSNLARPSSQSDKRKGNTSATHTEYKVDPHRKRTETIEVLQSKIRELDKKTELQNVRHEELMLEMAALRRAQQGPTTVGPAGPGATQRASSSHSRHSSLGQNESLPDSPLCSTPDSAMSRTECVSTPTPVPALSSVLGDPSNQDGLYARFFTSSRGQGGSAEVTNSSKHEHSLLLHDSSAYSARAPFIPTGISHSLPRPATSSSTHHHKVSPSPPTRTGGRKRIRRSTSVTDLSHFPITSGASQRHGPATTNNEIERIIAKIQQDNKILAELEKRTGVSGQTRDLSQDGRGQGGLLVSHGPLTSQNAFLQQPTFTTVLPSNVYLPAGTTFLQATTTTSGPSGHRQQGPLGQAIRSNTTNVFSSGALSIPTIITTAQLHAEQKEQERSRLLNGSHIVLGKTIPLTPDQSSVDVLDIPEKGRCFVYIARYSYDPFQQSPNENLEAELYLNAGDYVLVWGSMDEDGFLDGELLDGRRGLVPSNYVERLVGEDLLEFHQQVVLGVKDHPQQVDRQAATLNHQLHNIHHEGTQDESQRLIIEELMNRRQDSEYSYLNLEDITEDDGERFVPPPQQLTLERQLNKSILISWSPPDAALPGTLDSYQVYVNGLLRCTVKANERTRALIEGVDTNRPHRISVRGITPNHRSSRDAACTMIIGKDVPLCPSCVRATHITSTSAVISWLPSNSNFHHVVSVNNVEVRNVKPSVYRHAITVLTPNTTYRVTVRSKNVRAPHFDEKNIKQMEKLSAHTEFRTLPKGLDLTNLPDPPVDVQVEIGPQDNTLLVTWNPVTTGTSNGAVVTGYAIFADGRKILEIDSPSGDHALLDLNRFQGMIPKQVTVRTKSRDSLSSDSIPIPISPQVLRGTRRSGRVVQNSYLRRGHPALPVRHGGSSLEGDESFSDLDSGYPQQNVPAIEVTSDPRGLKWRGGRHQPPYLAERPSTARGHYQGPLPPPPSHHPQDDYHVPPPQHMMPHPPPIRGRGGLRAQGLRKPAEPIRHRLFVALFDYDPPNMSPNPDACDEELPFREGQTIKIYGEKDMDGFYWGEASGRRGYVPCNMVSEMHPDDERAVHEMEGGDGGIASGRERRAMGDRLGDIYANMPMKKMVAMYDYDPRKLSPNVDSEVELSFISGDTIYVYGEKDDDGFFMGEVNGVRGLVPSNFLTEALPDYEHARRRGGSAAPHMMGTASAGGPIESGSVRRGAGPVGARGPPPPPREPTGPRRDGQAASLRSGDLDPRRKVQDAAYPLDHPATSHQQQVVKTHFDGTAVGRRVVGRGGSGTVPGGGRNLGRQPPSTGPDGHGPNLPSQHRGLPSVVPHFLPDLDSQPNPSHQAGPADEGRLKSLLGGTGRGIGVINKLPGVFTAESHTNFMQKFSELAHTGGSSGAAVEGAGPTPPTAPGGVDSFLSKGKELIFKKFGLGE